jgi:carbamoyltransferase
MDHAYWGPGYSDEEIEQTLQNRNAKFKRLDHDHLCDTVAQLIDEGNVIGWFQGRMEFGPRALGNRSILADPRDPNMKDNLNLKIKFREAFRPFAPTVIRERTWDYFDFPSNHDSPYMLLVAQVNNDHRHIPSVTHVDGSARVQSVDRDTNPLYYDVIKAFEKRTGCPVIINTSFNVRGEPIVCDPDHAYVCFMRTHMDYLVLGPYLLYKNEQPELKEATDWRKQFELD